MRRHGALVDLGARETVALITEVAGAGERGHRVCAGSVGVTVVRRHGALVDVCAACAAALVAKVAGARE